MYITSHLPHSCCVAVLESVGRGHTSSSTACCSKSKTRAQSMCSAFSNTYAPSATTWSRLRWVYLRELNVCVALMLTLCGTKAVIKPASYWVIMSSNPHDSGYWISKSQQFHVYWREDGLNPDSRRVPNHDTMFLMKLLIWAMCKFRWNMYLKKMFWKKMKFMR